MNRYLKKLLCLIGDAFTDAESFYYKMGYKTSKLLSQNENNITCRELGYHKLTKDNYRFWDVVDEIDWKHISLEYDKPYEVMKFRLIKLFDMEEEIDTLLMRNLFEETRARVICLKSTLEEYALEQFGDRHVFGQLSDDGFHYLCTHIVGCGKEAYDEAMNHPETVIPKYVENNDFYEGFEYGFDIN